MRHAICAERTQRASSLSPSVCAPLLRTQASTLAFFCAVRQTSSLNDQAQQTSLNFVCWSSPASMLAMQPSYPDVWRACSPHAGRQSKASKLAADHGCHWPDCSQYCKNDCGGVVNEALAEHSLVDRCHAPLRCKVIHATTAWRPLVPF